MSDVDSRAMRIGASPPPEFSLRNVGMDSPDVQCLAVTVAEPPRACTGFLGRGLRQA
ncbi:hypothetical protein GCM10027030_11760 [Luteococcus sediminum]